MNHLFLHETAVRAMIADLIAEHAELDGLTLRLFVARAEPVVDIDSFTQADATGYTAGGVALPAWSAVRVFPNGTIGAYASVDFTGADGDPTVYNSIKGCYLVKDGELVGWSDYAMPKTLGGVGSAIVEQVNIQLNPLAPGGSTEES